MITQETKQEKLLELANLINQYDNGERETLNANEYNSWIKIVEMLRAADIDEAIYEDFLINPTHYIIADNTIIYNENWAKEQEEAEQIRIAKLHMTKYDFLKYVLKPNGITYPMLLQVISASEEMSEAWDLCQYVYRGDETLNKFIFEQIPNITPADLTAIFEQYGVADDKNSN